MVRSQVIPEELSNELLVKCEKCARDRDDIKYPGSTQQMRAGCDGWVIHSEGLRGECGFAQWLGTPELVQFDARRRGDDGADIEYLGKRIQVKVSTHDYDPHLKFNQKGSQRFKEDVFLAVLARLDRYDPKLVELWGWITRDEFFKEDDDGKPLNREDTNYRHGLRFVVKPRKLHPMSRLWQIFD
jgi:hypothetical protein